MLLALGAFRRRRDKPERIETIVLLQTAAIGDAVLMSCATVALKSAYPGCRLVVVAGADNMHLAGLLPAVDDVLVFHAQRPFACLAALRRLRPDLVVDFGSWPRVNALLAALGRARFTAGFRTPGAHRHYAFDLSVRHSAGDHEVRNYGRLVEALTGASCGPPQVSPPAASPSPVGEGRACIVFHPWASGAGKRMKEWPGACWAELAGWAGAKGFSVVLTGGGADQPDSRALAVLIAERNPALEVVDLAGRTPMPDLLALLQASQAVVSVNTGVMHMAAALGAPTVGLSGPTNPRRWGPYGPHTRSVSPSAGQHSYLHLGHEFPRGATSPMGHLRVQDVRAALEELI